jgi:transposase-like protein
VSRECFNLSRRFVAVDGTFLKARFIQTLLLAVGIDADGHNTILAWAVVESENRNSWEWFFRHLRRAIPTISLEACTLISDRDKGLLFAEPILGPLIMAARCCHHLKENFIEKFGRGLAPQFWAVARARTEARYIATLQKLREIKEAAATYLEQALPETWAEAWFLGRRYGHDTSNIVESVNKTLKLERELPIVELLDSIWHRVMQHRANRLAAAIKEEAAGSTWSSWAAGILLEGRKWAGGNRVSLCLFN